MTATNIKKETVKELLSQAQKEIDSNKISCETCKNETEIWARYMNREDITSKDLSYCKKCKIKQSAEVKSWHEFYLS